MRSEPAHRSEMVSQCFYGEDVEVLSEEGEWLQIRQRLDGYEGWVTRHFLQQGSMNAARCTTSLLTDITVANGTMKIPMGSLIASEAEGVKLDAKTNYQSLLSTAMQFLNAPYLWGGKSILGIDCSGLMQIVFRCNGYALLRDASQQAEMGDAVVRLEDTLPGDLAFFCNEKGRVTHVGMVMEGQRIIHASGSVRIDLLTKDGILREADRKLTHTAHSYRRLISASEF